MISPPRTAELLLESLGATIPFREPLLGDLAEGFAARSAQNGVDAARRWYYWEAMRAAPHLLWDGVRGLRARDVRHIAGVVFAAYCFTLMLAFLTSMFTGAVLATWNVSPRLFAHTNDSVAYVAFALGFVATIIGGVIAAWLDERAPLVSALALGVVWAGASIVILTIGPGNGDGWLPVWAPLAQISGTSLGGVLRVRALRSVSRSEQAASVTPPT
jgi:hypothetical protein